MLKNIEIDLQHTTRSPLAPQALRASLATLAVSVESEEGGPAQPCEQTNSKTTGGLYQDFLSYGTTTVKRFNVLRCTDEPHQGTLWFNGVEISGISHRIMSTAENTYRSETNNGGLLSHLKSLSSSTTVDHLAAITGPVLWHRWAMLGASPSGLSEPASV
ncbi:hypothetical protein PG984_010619 [Apiospora sp. TS-2023a]